MSEPRAPSASTPSTPSTPSTTEGRDSGLEIRLNGARHRLPRGMSLRELVESVGCDPQAVAVEVNGEIVRRARLAATDVAAGDVVEIVRFVQGG